MSQKGTSVSAICLELKVMGPRPLGESCCFCFPRSRQSGNGAPPLLCLLQAGSQLHLQDFTTMLESCSTLGVLPT